MGKPTGKRPLGSPRCRWEDNIKIDLKQKGVNTRNWVDSAQDRNDWSPCKCGIEPMGSISHAVSQLIHNQFRTINRDFTRYS